MYSVMSELRVLVNNTRCTTQVQKDMSHFLRKRTACICENKDADQLRSNCEADHCLCFRYMDSKFPQTFKCLAIFCEGTDQLVSDLFENYDAAHIKCSDSIVIVHFLGGMSHCFVSEWLLQGQRKMYLAL